MKLRITIVLVLITGLIFSSCAKTVSKPYLPDVKIAKGDDTSQDAPVISESQTNQASTLSSDIDSIKNEIIEKYIKSTPGEWGEKVTGVKSHIVTEKKIVALTFDACGGKNGNGYDSKLIDYLKQENVPATLFINSRWIDANYDTFVDLSKCPLFEIENHGLMHQPLSVNGKSAYGIQGTKNITEVIDEIQMNEQKIRKITGRKPKYFRSGTDYYDEIAVKAANDLGEKIISYSILGDAGATYTASQIKKACLGVKPGSIIIFHMNHPEKDTAEGIIEAVPQLKKTGYEFVKLEDYDNSIE